MVVEANEVESEFKNSYARGPQLMMLPLVSFTETIVSVHVRVAFGCQIDCVIVKPEVSGMNIESLIVITALVQACATIFTVKLREP